MSGDELPAFGAVIDGGLRANNEFAFDLRVGVDDELKLVRILIPRKSKCELSSIHIGNGARDGRGFGGIAQWCGLGRNRDRPK